MLTMIPHVGLFRYKRMLLGLVNSPATFQRIMDMTLARLKWKCCLLYIDDIIIFSREFIHHKEDVREVLRKLKQAALTLKLTKCELTRENLL